MPPTDRLSGALSIASTVVGIASNIKSLGIGGGGEGFKFEGLGNMPSNMFEFQEGLYDMPSLFNSSITPLDIT